VWLKLVSSKMVSIAVCMLGAAVGSLAQASPGWEEPRLRKEFTGSYGIDSKIEPDLSDAQREVLQQVEPLMGKDNAQALRILEEANLAEPSARYDFLIGNLKLEARDVEAAKRHYSDAIKKFPNYRQAYKNIGLILAQQEDFPMAARALSKVLELGEADGTAYGLLARCHLAQGNLVAAETGFRQAILLQADVLDWRRGLLGTLIRQRKTADATALADELIARDPDNPEFHQQKAQIQIAAGDLDAAARTLELVARAGWSKAQDLHQLGDIYLKQEQPQLALSAYRRAFAADPAQDIAKCLRAVEVLSASRAPDEAAALAAAFRETFSATLPQGERARLARIEGADRARAKSGRKGRRVVARSDRGGPARRRCLDVAGQVSLRAQGGGAGHLHVREGGQPGELQGRGQGEDRPDPGGPIEVPGSGEPPQRGAADPPARSDRPLPRAGGKGAEEPVRRSIGVPQGVA
jgi:tetratricopeptide (TPR) repeat protein